MFANHYYLLKLLSFNFYGVFFYCFMISMHTVDYLAYRIMIVFSKCNMAIYVLLLFLTSLDKFGGKYILGCLRKIFYWCCVKENIFKEWSRCVEAKYLATEMKKTNLRSCREANIFKAALLYIYFCFKCMLV